VTDSVVALRRAKAAHDRTGAALDAALVACAEESVSLRAMGEALGVSHVAVLKRLRVLSAQG
jgi:hypothetical protein